MPIICIIILLAFLIDLLIGDPVYPLHPVRITGILIKRIENLLRRLIGATYTISIMLPVTLILINLSIYLSVHYGLRLFNPILTTVWDIFVVYSCIALKDMLKHSINVMNAIKNKNIDKARLELSKIVARNTAILNKKQIIKATVESVAESLIDGFFAPIFWLATVNLIAIFIFPQQSRILSISAIIVYRTVNTLDSMVGYKNNKYMVLGRASAHLDDILNFFPARLSVIFMYLSALIISADATNGLKIFFRDRLKHESPNSAHAESFFAGALHLQLGGNTIYHDRIAKKDCLGNDDKLPDYKDIAKANLIMIVTCSIQIACFLIIRSLM